MSYYVTLGGQVIAGGATGYNLGNLPNNGYRIPSAAGNFFGNGVNVLDTLGSLAGRALGTEAFEAASKVLGGIGGGVAAAVDVGGLGYGLGHRPISGIPESRAV